jgi:Flp pilus assembly protein TadD
MYQAGKLANLIFVMLALAGCSSFAIQHELPSISDEQLLAPGILDEPESAPRAAAEVFSLSPEMLAFLDVAVVGKADERAFGDLIGSMKALGVRNLVYDNLTLTPSEAFAARRGDCLTFTNMFVQMAREVGLNARFQEVRVPPYWIRHGNTMVLRRHVNVLIHFTGKGMTLEGMGQMVVDFDEETRPASFSHNVISDDRALAHFFNNWAAESLDKGDTELAFAYLEKALTEGDREFSPAWNLLGVLYQRAGHEELAEQAWLRALQAEPDEEFVMSNLQHLYARRGDSDLSARYHRLVDSHRRKNPYYQSMQARRAYDAGDFETAIRLLRRAVRMQEDESEFRFQLRDAYLAAGDADRAAASNAAGEAIVAAAERLTVESTELPKWRVASPDEANR